jgi:hypothetical protein
MEFIGHPKIVILIGILSVPVYGVLAKIFYGEKFENLGEAIKYLVWPDWYSLFRGQFWQDWDATMKFNIFLALCFGWVAAITKLLARHVL